MTNKVSREGIVALLLHEGVVPAPYFDSKGILTWGVGHTAAAGAPDPNWLPMGMPKNLPEALVEVFTVFAADLESYAAAVNKALKVPVKQHEFDALVSFHFNTGAIARAEVTRLLNKGDREGAAKAFMNWKTPAEIRERRMDEQHLFKTGEYPDGNIQVWKVNDQGKITWKIAKKLLPEEALEMMEMHWGDDTVPQYEEPEDTGLLEQDEFGTPLLARGAKGEEVGYAQTMLIALGASLHIDNDFGPRTHDAVVAFQAKKRLRRDGKIGPITWAALKKAYEKETMK